MLVFGISVAPFLLLAVSALDVFDYYSEIELRRLITGNTQAEVIELLGTPDLNSSDHGSQVYIYKGIVRDGRRDWVAPETHVRFEEHRSGTLVVETVTAKWIRKTY